MQNRQRRTVYIGIGRARSMSISLSISVNHAKSISDRAVFDPLQDFVINRYFNRDFMQRRTYYVEIAVLVPCMIQSQFQSRFQYLNIDIVERGLSISIAISCIVEHPLNVIEAPYDVTSIFPDHGFH
jgi:hypothetical protein